MLSSGKPEQKMAYVSVNKWKHLYLETWKLYLLLVGSQVQLAPIHLLRACWRGVLPPRGISMFQKYEQTDDILTKTSHLVDKAIEVKHDPNLRL